MNVLVAIPNNGLNFVTLYFFQQQHFFHCEIAPLDYTRNWFEVKFFKSLQIEDWKLKSEKKLKLTITTIEEVTKVSLVISFINSFRPKKEEKSMFATSFVHHPILYYVFSDSAIVIQCVSFNMRKLQIIIIVKKN